MKRRIVILFPNIPSNWSTDYPYQTANELIKKGYVVVLFRYQGSRSLKELILETKKFHWWKKQRTQLYEIFPVDIIPLKRFPLIHEINYWINIFTCIIWLYIRYRNKIDTKKKPILWFFSPVVSLRNAFCRFFVTLYDCVDYFRGDPLFTKKQKTMFIQQENELIRLSDTVVVNSNILYTLHSKIRKDIRVVPQGFRLEEFRKKSITHIQFPKDKPIVGYVGALNYRLDYHLLATVAKKLPQYRFVFVGPLQEETTSLGKQWLEYAKKNLFSLPNVTVIYGVDKNEIKAIICQFTIGMIPYDARQDFNRYCYPMKLFEYFYCGIPVISTPIEELTHFSKYIIIAESIDDWEKRIQSILNGKWLKTYQTEQKMIALQNSWENKVYAIMSHLNEDDPIGKI